MVSFSCLLAVNTGRPVVRFCKIIVIMGRKGKNTSFEKRQLVIFHHAKGRTHREIAEILNMRRSTVGDIIRRYENEDRIEYVPQRGQPRKLTDRDVRSIIRKVNKNPRISAPQLAKDLSKESSKTVHPETIRKILRKSGYHGRVARKKPLVSEVNRKKRLEFANNNIDKDEAWWNDVIFVDESPFSVFGQAGRVMVWRKVKEDMKIDNLQPTVKHGGGKVMVWGCMSAAGVGELVFIDGNMNKEQYLQILKQNLHKSAEKLGIRNTFKFYQDNDPKHKSYIVRNWLLYNCPKVIDTPPQSPDCNPIENLWNELNRRLRKIPVSSKEELKRRLKEEWGRIDGTYTSRIVASMPRRLQHVIQQNGYPTRY